MLAERRIDMETVEERGQAAMAQSVIEQASEHFTDTVHKASHAASVAAEAIADGAGAARRAAKHSGYAAAELFYSAKRRVQQNPIEIVAVTFAACIAAGTVISCLMKRKESGNKAERLDGAQ